MIGDPIFNITISGDVSTKSSSNFKGWNDTLEENLSSVSSSFLAGQLLAVCIKLWINSNRFHSRRNDIDNLIKPILDALTKMGKISDDSDVCHIEVTKYPTSGPEQIIITCKEWLV